MKGTATNAFEKAADLYLNGRPRAPSPDVRCYSDMSTGGIHRARPNGKYACGSEA